MLLNTLGKSLLTGLVAFFSVVSVAIVGIIFMMYGMGQGAISGLEMKRYMVFAMPSLIGVVPMGIAAIVTSIYSYGSSMEVLHHPDDHAMGHADWNSNRSFADSLIRRNV